MLDQDKILIFDSNFECGNLDRASIVSLSEYDLFLNPDTNTKGHSQWFFFAVTNTEKDRTIKFNILNCCKPIGLFKHGMKPLTFSEIDYEENGNDWTPNSENALYFKNDILKNPTNERCKSTYFTLSFDYTFKYTGDRVYFAFSRPYSFTMLKTHLGKIKENLIDTAKNVVPLDADGLQNRISEFLENEGKPVDEKGEERKMKQHEEAQLKTKFDRRKEYYERLINNRSLSVPIPENNLANEDIMKEYVENEKQRQFNWLNPQDVQIETEKFIFRQETLSRTLIGFPVDLITITSHK